MTRPRADGSSRAVQRRRPAMPIHGIMGWLAGGATVPGRALIDVLPFVEQMSCEGVLASAERWRLAPKHPPPQPNSPAAVRPSVDLACVHSPQSRYQHGRARYAPAYARSSGAGRYDSGGIRPERSSRRRGAVEGVVTRGFDGYAGAAADDVGDAVAHGTMQRRSLVTSSLVHSTPPAAVHVAMTAAEASSLVSPVAVKPTSAPSNSPVPTATETSCVLYVTGRTPAQASCTFARQDDACCHDCRNQTAVRHTDPPSRVIHRQSICSSFRTQTAADIKPGAVQCGR